MNILITSQHAGMAGSTYSTFYLARGLHQRGHQVFVACPPATLLAGLLNEAGLRHLPFQIRGKLDRRAMKKMAGLIRQYDIEIVNAQSSKDRYISILARWFYRLPVALLHTRRQMALSNPLLSPFYEHGTDKNIAVSRGVKASLVKMGISSAHIEVIYNGTPAEKYQSVDHALTSQLREKFDIRANDFVIGCVARKKEQDQLLKALALLDEPVSVIFAGIERTAEYEQIIRSYQLPHRVQFAGKVPQQDVLGYYPLFDIKVLPSTIEGLSQSLLEAMALGVPVIATDLGGNGELVDEGKNGFLFENGNIRQLAERIQKLQANPALRRQMGEAGKKTALKDFSIEKTIALHEGLFIRLLSEKLDKSNLK
jgi:glycosyltransferase involved in cell wall biosynthesis